MLRGVSNKVTSLLRLPTLALLSPSHPHRALHSTPRLPACWLTDTPNGPHPTGDVVLPGLLVAFCRRFDLAGRLPAARGYFGPCCAGYGGGLLLTYCALWFSWFGDEGQPGEARGSGAQQVTRQAGVGQGKAPHAVPRWRGTPASRQHAACS